MIALSGQNIYWKETQIRYHILKKSAGYESVSFGAGAGAGAGAEAAIKSTGSCSRGRVLKERLQLRLHNTG